MAEALQSFLSEYGPQHSETPSIPHRQSCCCGNDSCAYLRRNQAALDELEHDVWNAAQLGQALLVRHEAYMADAEKERKAMTAHIEDLEVQKRGLQKKNETLIEDNRNLLDQLEAVNNAVSDSDAHASSLQATLLSAQHELQKLAHLVQRTEVLEREIEAFEREQAAWQENLDVKEEAEKSATQRWQKAERTISHLHDQLERIERESKEEKERHEEVVGRLQRRHAVEKELNGAAGRLKSAAASKAGGNDVDGTVVSHFVKDILQDNATLQMGIVELREMLENSNEEVEKLRDQLSVHQPAADEDHVRPELDRRVSLQEEMCRSSSQELHVHHHYHAPSTAANRSSSLRRPKKKRYAGLTPGNFTPNASGRSTPRSSISYGTPSSAATILQQTAVTIPQPIPGSQRWSAQSNNAYQSAYSSSVPSSPQSTTNRTSSIFDRVFSDAGHESSRPTTPDSEIPDSPFFAPSHAKRLSSSSHRAFSAPFSTRKGFVPAPGRPSLDSIMDSSVENLSRLDSRQNNDNAIAEENEADWQHDASASMEEISNTPSPMCDDSSVDFHNDSFFRRPLRRAASHESLLSVSGMGIHTLKNRPSQMLISHGGLSSGTAISNAHAHAARPAMFAQGGGNSRSILSGVAADQRVPKQAPTRKVSGWIFGRWGATPTSTPTTSTAVAKDVATAEGAGKPGSVHSASDKASLTDSQTTPKQPRKNVRSPGINQPGPILGFFPEVKLQHAPIVKSLDQEALQKVLHEE